MLPRPWSKPSPESLDLGPASREEGSRRITPMLRVRPPPSLSPLFRFGSSKQSRRETPSPNSAGARPSTTPPTPARPPTLEAKNPNQSPSTTPRPPDFFFLRACRAPGQPRAFRAAPPTGAPPARCPPAPAPTPPTETPRSTASPARSSWRTSAPPSAGPTTTRPRGCSTRATAGSPRFRPRSPRPRPCSRRSSRASRTRARSSRPCGKTTTRSRRRTAGRSGSPPVGEFRPDAAGVSCKAKGPAPEGREGRRAGVSCKRNAPVGSPDDDDDRIPLSQLMKKRRGPQPVPNGEPKKGHGDVQANSVGPSLGDHPPERPPVNRGAPKASAGQRGGASQQLKVAAVEQGKGRICQSREAGGLSRAMPTLPPTDSAVGNNSQKKSSKADGAEDGARIGGKQGSAAGPPFQVRESARAGAETPKENTGSALDATVSLVLNTIREQGKTNGGMHKMKAPLETNGFGEKACMVARDIREQQKTQGQVLKTDVLQGTNGIGQQNVKLGTVQNREVSDGARLRTSDKQVSSSLKPNNQLTLHSEQMPSERPTSLQPNNQLTLHSEKMPVKSSLPSEVTRNWESASEVYTSCLVNNEICMQAACALLRQKKLSIQEGKDGYTVVNKSDVHRAASLAEFLLDGNLQGPLKRTAEELAKRDSGGVDLLARVAMGFSEQLFSIYRNKEDPYFR
uniref:Uncharacterized protein n=1 Tax=Setaria italica TaxID=4555 RepID=K3XR47_SETIT